MSKRVSDEDRIEQFFINGDQLACKVLFDRIETIMKTRGIVAYSAKPGRKSRAKGAVAMISKADQAREELLTGMAPGGQR